MTPEEDTLFEACRLLARDFVHDHKDTHKWSEKEIHRFLDGIYLGVGMALKFAEGSETLFALSIGSYTTAKALRRLGGEDGTASVPD